MFHCQTDNHYIGLAQLAHKLGLDAIWDFGAAQHNKDKVDSIRSGEKRVMRKGVMDRELLYNTKQPHVVHARNFCQKKYDKETRI